MAWKAQQNLIGPQKLFQWNIYKKKNQKKKKKSLSGKGFILVRSMRCRIETIWICIDWWMINDNVLKGLYHAVSDIIKSLF